MTVLAAALYGDLVARFPRAGGQYVYLREAFGPVVGFLYGWTLFLVIQTGTIAAVAVAFGRFTAVLLPAMESREIFGTTAERFVAIMLIALLTAANCRGVEVGKRIQNTFTLAKIGAIFGVLLLCAIFAGSGDTLATNFAHPWQRIATALPLGAAIGSAMVGALFSSDAWNNITFAAEEVRTPERTVPRALVIGTVLVIAMYLAANVAYLSVLPALDRPMPPTRSVGASRTPHATGLGRRSWRCLLGRAGVVDDGAQRSWCRRSAVRTA
jgi:APA family basic amino acid/polyamine antiporter